MPSSCLALLLLCFQRIAEAVLAIGLEPSLAVLKGVVWVLMDRELALVECSFQDIQHCYSHCYYSFQDIQPFFLLVQNRLDALLRVSLKSSLEVIVE